MNELLRQLDLIYDRYGYDRKENHNGVRVYIFRKSVYPGVDIVKIDDDADIETIKKEFQQQNYSVRIQDFKSAHEAESLLFRTFFRADGLRQSLTRKYEGFVQRQMSNLPNEAKYQYIRAPYEYSFYAGNGILEEIQVYDGNDNSNTLIAKVVELINTHKGPLFIIMEAAAGFGKTCSAYEILNDFINVSVDKVPFFTELSRNRQATIFKYILQNEIEEQFASLINTQVAIHEIKNGRIPLIIDGFDELISKDFSYKKTGFQEVETMLATIVDLLQGEAKIIITSRKTAIFNGEEFLNWLDMRSNNYSLARFTIQEPTIENWLDNERIEIIEESGLPLRQIANPVLLSYLKHINIDTLKQIVLEQKSIVDKYFDFLLSREQERQELLIQPETQLHLFQRIVRLMTEMEFSSESKEFFKGMFLSFAKTILETARKIYPSEIKPSIDLLADRLTNHAFLDRKGSKAIGVVNDFIFGTLIGQNLISGKYLEHQPDFVSKLHQSFAVLAVSAFKVQPVEMQLKLWEVFHKNPFPYDIQFYFNIDTLFKKQLMRNYYQNFIEGFEVWEIDFVQQGQFKQVTFSKCIFHNCNFKLTAFEFCSFVNCSFYDCNFDHCDTEYSDVYFTELGCYDNNGFIQSLYNNLPVAEVETVNYHQLILERFFKKNTTIPRVRSVSQIKTELNDYDTKEIGRTIQKLKSDGLILLNGDQGFISKEGIKYYNAHFSN